VVALLTGLFVSILAAMQLSRANDARVSDRFSSSAESIVGAVENQIQTEFTLLRGTAGFFDSSQTVTVDEFGTYIARLDLERNYPGVLGIGFAVTDTERSRLEQLASQLDPNREVEVEAWPEGERSPYSTILFLEPRNEMNLEAIGFDMMSEATRREAMMEAARTGRTTLSGRVQLVQEIDPVKQPGFLVYTPLYRNDGRDHYGWVYSPLRAYDLFEALFPHDDRAEISISIFDGAPSEASLLYRSATPPDDARETIVRTIDVGDREWQIVMVVDDEEQVLAMTVEQLRELGYTVIHAKDGETALRKLGDNPGVRVVLTDIVMPGMNGNELAERALAAVPDLKIVFVSGFDTISDSSKIAEQHGIVKLQKPFTRQDLALAIRATFDTLKGAADDGGSGSFPTDEPV
jgi:CHASE1-domain containing sensor protein